MINFPISSPLQGLTEPRHCSRPGEHNCKVDRFEPCLCGVYSLVQMSASPLYKTPDSKYCWSHEPNIPLMLFSPTAVTQTATASQYTTIKQ